MSQLLNSEKNVFKIEAVPDWVKERSVDCNINELHQDSPYYYLLVDYQDKITNDAIYSYSHSIQKINDASRIEEASLYLNELNKNNQGIIFHSLEIIRNEKRINVLDIDEISVIQRERSLENHITDNRLTVSLSISDLREGDIIDYKTTFIERVDEHPVNGKHYLASYWLQWNCQVIEQHIRVINGSKTAISLLKSTGIGDKHKVENKEIAATEEFEESYQDLSLISIEPTAPSWIWPDFIQFTSKKTWQEISSYLFNYYLEKDAFSNKINIENIDLLELSDDKELNALKIIRFVQNNIRYKGENHGIYSHTPKSPDVILKKRAGDCKDKSNLLISLLKKIGIDASLVLVNAQKGMKIKELNPSAYHFNHMIVRVVINDKEYFFDPTIQKQSGNFQNSAELDYGYGLILTQAGEELVKLPYDLAKRVLTLRHEYNFKNLKEKAELKITRQFFYHRADNIRRHFHSNEKSTIQEEYLQWAKEESDLDLKMINPISIVEDHETENLLKTVEVYEICNLEVTNKDDNIGLLLNTSLSDYIIPNKDNFPVRIEQDGEVSHTVIVDYARIPDIFPTKEEIDNKFFKYLDTVMTKGNKLIFVSLIKSYTTYVKPKDIKEYSSEVEEMENRSMANFAYKSSSFIQDNYFEWVYYAFAIGLMYLAFRFV